MSKKKNPFKLICIWGADECHRYSSCSNLANVYNIGWDDNRNFRDMLKILDRILEIGGNIFLRNETVIQKEKLITNKGNVFSII